MRRTFKPYPYQERFIDHLEGGCENIGCIEMGLGKTVAVLTFLDRMIKADRAKGNIRRFLVVAPRLVAIKTWPDELEKWEHLQDLRLGTCTGATPAPKRVKILTDSNLDIVCTNYENLTWMCDTFPPGQFPFYGLVLDEASRLANAGSKRFDKFRYRAHEFAVRIAMDGTPSSEGMHKMFGPVYMVTSQPFREGALGRKMSMTALLGSSYQSFIDQWFIKDEYTHKITPRQGAIEGIAKKIAPITFVARARDHLDLPELIVQDHHYELPRAAKKQYEQLEEEFVVELQKTDQVQLLEMLEEDDFDERTVDAANPAVLKNKLRQLCSGFLYSYRLPTSDELEDMRRRGVQERMIRETTWLHHAKLDLYREIVEGLMGEPHLAVYGYQAEIPAFKFSNRLGSDVPERVVKETIDAWNRNELPCLALHPKSAAHGLNLQEGGAHHIVFIDLPWSRADYDQVVARLHRMGQEFPVIVHRLIARGTAEQDVVDALTAKGAIQELVLEAIKRRSHGA